MRLGPSANTLTDLGRARIRLHERSKLGALIFSFAQTTRLYLMCIASVTRHSGPAAKRTLRLWT